MTTCNDGNDDGNDVDGNDDDGIDDGIEFVRLGCCTRLTWGLRRVRTRIRTRIRKWWNGVRMRWGSRCARRRPGTFTQRFLVLRDVDDVELGLWTDPFLDSDSEDDNITLENSFG